MTDAKKGSRLGFDPLAGKDNPKGIDGLIRQTTQDAQTTQKTPGDRGARGKPLPRINMAFDPGHLDYLRAMSGLEGISITRYVYNLIEADMKARQDLYSKIITLKEQK